jgi:hypothetical protein
MKTELTIGENLKNDVLGKFQADGKRIEKINTIHLLIRSPDQITRWLPRYILILIDDTEQLFQFENSKWLPTEISNDYLQISLDQSQEMNIHQLNDQIEQIKQLYMTETEHSVIDKRYSEVS